VTTPVYACALFRQWQRSSCTKSMLPSSLMLCRRHCCIFGKGRHWSRIRKPWQSPACYEDIIGVMRALLDFITSLQRRWQRSTPIIDQIEAISDNQNVSRNEK